MSGIYIPGVSMPKDGGALCIIIHPDGKVCHFFDLQGEQIATAVPVHDHGRILKVLKTERECVSRDCDRNCGKCDLSLEQSEILKAYNALIAMLDPADKEETE